MKNHRIGAAGLLLALAGCDSGPEPDQPRQISVANPFHQRLTEMGDLDRNLALRRAVQDSGFNCRRPEDSGYQEEYRGMPMWVVRCDDGRLWALFISPGGDVQVRSCAEAGQLGLPECRLEPAQEGG